MFSWHIQIHILNTLIWRWQECNWVSSIKFEFVRGWNIVLIVQHNLLQLVFDEKNQVTKMYSLRHKLYTTFCTDVGKFNYKCLWSSTLNEKYKFFNVQIKSFFCNFWDHITLMKMVWIYYIHTLSTIVTLSKYLWTVHIKHVYATGYKCTLYLVMFGHNMHLLGWK